MVKRFDAIFSRFYNAGVWQIRRQTDRWTSCGSTRWSQILAHNRNFCLPHLHSTPPLGGGGFPSEYCHYVWCGKTRMVVATRWLKIFEDMFIHFDRIHERDGRTDRHTPPAWRHRLRLHSIARQKCVRSVGQMENLWSWSHKHYFTSSMECSITFILRVVFISVARQSCNSSSG